MTFRNLMMRKLKVPTRQNCVRVHGTTAAANYTLLLCLIYVWLLLFNKFYFCTFFFFYFSSRITQKKTSENSLHIAAQQRTSRHYTYSSVNEHTIIGQWSRLFGLFLWTCFSILEIRGIFMQYTHTTHIGIIYIHTAVHPLSDDDELMMMMAHDDITFTIFKALERGTISPIYLDLFRYESSHFRVQNTWWKGALRYDFSTYDC